MENGIGKSGDKDMENSMEFALCHPEYDLLSVFCLFREEP